MQTKKYLAIHHTAVKQDGFNQFNAVNFYHKQKWNMKSSLGWFVGYNDFIDTNGSLIYCRDYYEETMTVVGHNCDTDAKCDTISVCLAGDFNQELPNDKQIIALKNYITKIKEDYPNIQITFHRNLQADRTCPGTLFTQDYLDNVILEKNTNPPDFYDDIKSKQIIQCQQDLKESHLFIQKMWAYIMDILSKR